MIGGTDFGKSLGELNRDAMKKMTEKFGSIDFYARIHAEQMTLHGDPALVLNISPKPDYVIETPQILLKPSFISVADKSFNLKFGCIISEKLPVILSGFRLEGNIRMDRLS
jgi:hypothetical protein